MSSSANAVAALNGIASSYVSTVLTTSTRGNGAAAVKVVISSTMPLLLAPVLGVTGGLPISAAAYAEVRSTAGPCVVALNGAGSGLTLSGGTNVTAASCSVGSNAAVSVPCGTFLTTATLSYNSSAAPSQPCGGIRPPGGTAAVAIARKPTSDPLAGASAVTAATAGLSAVSGEAAPASPSVTGGGNIDFAYSVAATQAQAVADGCTATFASPTWTVICTGASHKIGSITLGGGINVNFNVAGSASTAYNFSGSINNSGVALNFGPGVYKIAKGLFTGGGTTTSFGAGAFTIGAMTSACSGAGLYSICNSGSALTFAGPSTFALHAGVYNVGGSSLTMGSGSANSFAIGAASDGNALLLGGAATTVLGDATGGSSLFQMVGNLNIAGGGNCTTLGAAARHDIKGALTTAGGLRLGAGPYFVTGYVAMGANMGGDVSCGGSVIGVSGSGVIFAVGGAATPALGACAGSAFCVASGFGNVVLTAPTSGTYANLLVLGPASAGNPAGAAFAEGASGTSLSGAFYFPNGPISLSGGSSVGDEAGQCLTLVGSAVALSGAAVVASSCLSGGSGGGSVLLVQ